jgi:hypothetical protein
VITAADKDKDGKLSKSEITGALTALFERCDAEKKGKLGEQALAAGVDPLLPDAAEGPRRRLRPSFTLAAAIVREADADGDHVVTLAELLRAGERLTDKADANRDGVVDETELTGALERLFSNAERRR